jgi:cellulose synthase/poly-beta-1,6-N-acetylglucosamine synthase-like glycosyltransferase
MKVRTFWLILLKIIGFFLALQGVNMVLYSFGSLTFVYSLKNTTESIIWVTLSIIFTCAFYFSILWLFVFKTSWIIDKLSLEADFDEEKIEINISLPSIMSIAIIVIGGIIFVQSLPQLCKQIFTFYQQKSILMLRESPTAGWIILYFSQAILGYLLMTNSKQITTFINKRACSDSTNENEQACSLSEQQDQRGNTNENC